eukprot:6428225-Prymnesium_polylepis.1
MRDLHHQGALLGRRRRAAEEDDNAMVLAPREPGAGRRQGDGGRARALPLDHGGCAQLGRRHRTVSPPPPAPEPALRSPGAARTHLALWLPRARASNAACVRARASFARARRKATVHTKKPASQKDYEFFYER